jgi:preprotein translocase subunit YajC
MNEGLMGFLPFIIIFVLFYFMLIRPQMKQAKEHRAMLDALKNGDEIMMGSGLLGKITKLNNNYALIEIANNVEIKIQKQNIHSLTLMTIMVAGGLTFAIPGVMPEAMAANANLFVSAENSQFDNYISGPQVVEVVVLDGNINSVLKVS